jgi:hypothetical protein
MDGGTEMSKHKPYTTQIGNREQQPHPHGVERPEDSPYKKKRKEKPWKDPRRIT